MADWDVKASKYLLKNPWIKVRQDDVQVKNEILDYYIVEERDGAVAVAITENNEIVLIDQYKVGIKERLLSLPTGYIDKKHKSPKHAVLSELQEETGFKAKNLYKLGAFYRSPGRHIQKVHIFLALDLQPIERNLEVDEEDIEVKLITFDKVLKLIDQGKITDMETVASVLLAKDFLDK